MDQTQLNPHAQACLRGLMRVWFDFERRLNRIELIKRLETAAFSLEDYQSLLLHLRQQVIEGSRWITRCASSFTRDYADVRSIVIGHANDEHKDYELLEKDYVACGGSLSDIQRGERNPGSDALHGFLMYRASLENPIDLLGAMWMIEGLGDKMATSWAKQIDTALGRELNCTRFLRYHAENDHQHLQRFYQMLHRTCTDQLIADRIEKTAIVVGRLYCLQLEEIDEA
ncbi:iron-containing redox enzyme family protein [Halioxenophilus aromaticivorans]|uniref:3-oxoacyl-ACP synthase n=1 Tax=Halioxenophilus aromaticivorans TaxID=1306992 RepID=A0AAV3UAB0_9ALTE